MRKSDEGTDTDKCGGVREESEGGLGGERDKERVGVRENKKKRERGRKRRL